MNTREQIAMNLGWIEYLDSDGLVQYAPPEMFEEEQDFVCCEYNHDSHHNNLTINEIEIDDEDLPF